MSQPSDVEALLLRFLESEGARLTGPVSTHTSGTPPRTACVGVGGGSTALVDAGPAATPWTSQKSMCSASTQERDNIEEAEVLPVLLPPSAAAHSSFAGSSTHAVAAAAPAATPRKRPRCSPGRASSGSESLSSTGSSNAAGGAVPHSAENLEEDNDADVSRAAPSSSSPSQPTLLSLAHPVVEFLASVQLQGYAAHLVDDEGLRTMPALVAAASSEAEVTRLLGPYASLQQQNELWRGLRRWAKEEARRMKAAAEERRRRQQLEAREQRQQQQKEKAARRKSRAARKGAQAKRDSGGGGRPLSTTSFTQLLHQDKDCFSFPSLFDHPCGEEDFSSGGLHATSSVDLLSTSWEAGQQQQRQQRPPPSPTRSAPPSATSLSCVSLTTSATQLMRELSQRRTRSRQARHCRLPGQRACESSEVGATQTVAIDVDAEEATVDESEEEQEEEQQLFHREEVDHTLMEGAGQQHLYTPGASQQSSESHLSSLLCSLQGPHDTEDQGEGQAPESSAGVCDDAHHLYSHNGEEWRMDQAPPPSSPMPHEAHDSGAGADLLERADVVVNALVASRHVSLSALSAHATLERLPTRPFFVPTHRPLRAADEEVPLRPAEETTKDDDASPCVQSALVEDTALTSLSSAGTEPAPENSTLLTDARARLEDTIRAALQLYNAKIVAVAASACGEEESMQLDEAERRLRAGPVCAVLQPWRGALQSEAQSASLIRWSPAPLHHSTPSSKSFSSSVQQPLGSSSSPETAPGGVSLFHEQGRVACPSSSLTPPATHGRATALPVTSTTPLDPTAAAAVDVVVSAPSSADVSTRTTARPTAAPCELDAPSSEDAFSRTNKAFVAHVDLNAERSEVASRSQSVAALTVCAQQQHQQHGRNEASWAKTDMAPWSNTTPTDGDVWSAARRPRRDAYRLRTCEEAVTGEGDAEGCTVDTAGSREPLWVDDEEVELGEERTDNAAAVTAATSGGSSFSTAPSHSPAPPQPRHRGPHRARHSSASDQQSTSSGEEWWDSYGIGALNYTQNNMNAPPTASQSVVSGGADGSPRGGGGGDVSPGSTPADAAWNASTTARSPVPREVVEVTSSEDEEEDEEAIEDVALTRDDPPPEPSRTPPAARGAYPQPPLSSTPNRSAHRTNTSVSPPSHVVDSRLQPSAWHRMSNEELRALCVEFGLAVRPTPTTAMLLASSLPPPASQASVDGWTHRSPSPGMTPVEWSSFGLAGVTSDTTTTNTITDGATTRASPRTCRALFDDVSETLASPHLTDSVVGAEKRSTDKRVVRMEREALLAALRLLHVRLRFRHDVAPFHLHRVEHVSGLPYKRVRAADLLDEAAVLTRDDLQQARVRHKAEEQAELERCVLSALVAEAAESVESYAQRVPTAAAAAPTAGDASSVHTSVLEAGSSSVNSPGSLLESSNAVLLPGTAMSSCYEQLLLREPVSVEAVTAVVQRSFPHVAHTRVQQLLALNEVIAAVVVAASPPRSPLPLPSAMSPRGAGPATAAAGAPLPPATHDAFFPSQETTQALGPKTLSQGAVRRANTRRYFAQRGYMTRGGTWGRGVGQRGRERGGRRH